MILGSKQDEPEGKVENEKEEEKVGAEEASGTDEKSTDQQAEQSASKEGSKDQVSVNDLVLFYIFLKYAAP